MKFATLVKNYGKLNKIGQRIIQNSENISICHKNYDKLSNEQTSLIHKFEKLATKSSINWKKNQESINEHWFGH